MYGFMFRNRWAAFGWALMMIVAAIFVVPRVEKLSLGNADAPAAAKPTETAFDRWVKDDEAEKKPAAGSDLVSRSQEGSTVTEVREVPASEAQQGEAQEYDDNYTTAQEGGPDGN